MQTTITPPLVENSFKQLVNLITEIILKHAPLQTASQKQKRIHKKPWINSKLLKMIKKSCTKPISIMKTNLINNTLKSFPTN